MPKPTCVKCKRFYQPVRNGVWIGENMPINNTALPGIKDEKSWKPYKVWQADLMICRGCGHELVTGYGHNPVSEHYMDNFQTWHQRVQYTVNDC